MEQLKFSIIVVCLNAGKLLLETVESIRKQTYGSFEIIVKDGLSSDGSLELLPSDERIRLFREKDQGIYDAMNQALCRVRGDVIYFLNCGDMFYDEHVLAKVDSLMEGCEKDGKALPENSIFYGDIFERLTGERVSSNPQIDAFACYRNVPCHQACFYGAELLKRKHFETGYRVRADYEHFLWCFFEGRAKMVYMPFLVADYEGGGFSEKKENRRQSQIEHREITGKYMTRGQLLKYRLYMLITLSPLRTFIARHKATAHVYNRIKSFIYRR